MTSPITNPGDTSMDLMSAEMWRELGRRLWRRKGLVCLTFLGVVFTVYLALQLVTERYEAEMQLLVRLGRENMEVPATVSNGGMYTTGVRKEELNSAIQLLSSQPLLERVVDNLGVKTFRFEPQPPTGLVQTLKYCLKQTVRWGKRRWGDLLVLGQLKRRLSDREEAIELLKGALRVEAVKDSDVILVALRLPDPDLGVRVLDALLQAYLERHIEVHRAPDVERFFNTQAASLESKLKELRAARERVREQTRLSTYDTQSKLLLTRLSDTEKEVESLKTQRSMIMASCGMAGDQATSASRARGMTVSTLRAAPAARGAKPAPLRMGPLNPRWNLERFPLPDPAADAIRDSLANMFIERVKLTGSYDETSVAVVKLSMEINMLEQLILRGLEMRISLLDEQTRDLEKQLEALNDGQEDLRRLEMETRIAEGQYESHMRRREEARISNELDRSRVANISVLNPPTRPYIPVYPRKLLIMALALPFGLLLGMLLALLIDYLGGTAPGDEDPSWPRASSGLETLPLEAAARTNAVTDAAPADGASKMVIRSSLLMGLLVLAVSVQAQTSNFWRPIGPDGGTVFAFTRDPFTPSRVLAGTHFNGVYRSTDGGMTWGAISSPFSDNSVFAIAFDPGTSGVVYAGTFEKGIYRSTDGGTNWTACNQGLTDLTIQGLAVDPFDKKHLMAATTSGAFQSRDSGGHWSLTTTDVALSAKGVLFDTYMPGVIYIGTIGRGVYRSIDGGSKWSAFNDGLPTATVNWLGYGQDTSKRIYAATAQGGYVLVPGNTAWQSLFAPELGMITINHILAHPVLNNCLLASTDLGVIASNSSGYFDQWTLWSNLPFRLLSANANGSIIHGAMIQGSLLKTSDSGKSWATSNRGMQNVFVGAVAGVPSGSQDVVFAGTDRGVYYNPSGTNQPAALTNQSNQFNEGIFSLLRHPSKNGVIYAGTERAGVWRSDNWGTSWTSASKGILPAQVYDVNQSLQWPNTVYAGSSSGLFVSRDGGQNWQVPPRLSIPRILSIATHPNYPGVAYFGSMNGQLFKTLDMGGSFFASNNGLPNENILAIRTDQWSRVYAITSTSGLYISADEGANWYPAQQGVTTRALSVDTVPMTPWTIYIGTSGSGVWRSNSYGESWTACNNGLGSPYVYSVAVDPTTTGTVYAGTLGHVYKSTNGGQNWSDASAGLPSGEVTRLLVEPKGNNPQVLYCSIKDRGIWISPDGGQSWASLNATGLPVQGVLPLTLAEPITYDKITPYRRMIVGTPLKGLYQRSTTDGTWAPINNGISLFIRTLAFDPKNLNTMYAGSLGDGLFKSTDGGTTWQNTGLSDHFIFKVEVDPQNSQKLFVGTSLGVVRSVDGGKTWSDMGQGAAFIYSMAADPRNRNTVYAGSGGGVLLRSTNGGQNWARVTQGLPALNLLTLAIHPTSGTLYASPERDGIWRSDDGGANWTHINSSALYGLQINSLAFDGSKALYAGSAEGGVFKSTDRGATWKKVASGLTSFNIAHLAAAPSATQTVYASTYNRGIFKTTNGGQSWVAAATKDLTTTRALAVAVDPNNSQIVYAGTADGIFKSSDGATSWKAAHKLAGVEITTIQIPLSPVGTVYAGSSNGEVYRSVDSGLNWTNVSTGLLGAPVRQLDSGATAGALYASSLGAGVARTTNSGSQWSGAVGSDFVQPFVIAMSMDPKTPSTLYAGTSGKGVLKSINGGVDWSPANVGLTNHFLLCMAIDPQDPRRVFAGTTGGVFVTLNSGKSWQALNNGLFNKVVTAVGLSPLDHNRLYCGTEGGGAFTLTLDSLALTKLEAQEDWRRYE